MLSEKASLLCKPDYENVLKAHCKQHYELFMAASFESRQYENTGLRTSCGRSGKVAFRSREECPGRGGQTAAWRAVSRFLGKNAEPPCRGLTPRASLSGSLQHKSGHAAALGQLEHFCFSELETIGPVAKAPTSGTDQRANCHADFLCRFLRAAASPPQLPCRGL